MGVGVWADLAAFQMCSALGLSGQLCPAEDLGGCVCVCVWTFVCLHKLLSICLPGGLRLWTKGGSENLTQPLGVFLQPLCPRHTHTRLEGTSEFSEAGSGATFSQILSPS